MKIVKKVPPSLLAILLLAIGLALAPATGAYAQEPTPVPQPGSVGDPQTAGEVIEASQLLGYQVVSTEGQALGTVEDLVVELSSVLTAARTTAPVEGPSRITYVVISVTLPNGQSRAIAAPLGAFAIDRQGARLTTAVQQGLLIAAPAWNPDVFLEPSDIPWDRDVRAYWLRVSVPVPEVSVPGLSVPGPSLPLTRLLEYPIVVLDSEQPATFDDLLIDISFPRGEPLPELAPEEQPVLTPSPSSARVIYALAQFQGPVLIPMSALHLDDAEPRFMLAASRNILENVPPAVGTEPGWDMAVRRYWTGLGFPVPSLGPEAPELFPRVTGPQSVGSLLFTANELIGHAVVNPQNQVLGTIRDLVIEVSLPGTMLENRVPFAVLGFGGFLGINETLVTVPMGALVLDQVRNLFVLDASPDEVRQAPRFVREELPSVIQPDSYNSIIEYWQGILGVG